MRILIVDDEKGVRDATRRLFKAFHSEFQIIEATGVETALFNVRLATSRATPFDVIITDLNMPQKNDGLELINYLRNDSIIPGTKVVLYCCEPSSLIVEEALELGAIGFISKNENLLEGLEKLRIIKVKK